MKTKKIYITRQQLFVCCLMIALLGVVLTFIQTNVFAGWPFDGLINALKSDCTGKLEDIQGGMYGVATEIFGAGYVDKMLENKIIGTVATGLKGLGAGVAIALMVAKMLDEIQKAQDPVESLLRSLFEMTMTIVIIIYIDDFIAVIDKLGAVIINICNEAGSTPSEGKMTLAELASSMNKDPDEFGDIFSIWVSLFIPWAIAFLQSILARVLCYSIVLEIGVRRMFIPFAIADIGYEGIRSQGFRYLKKYLGAFIKEALLLAICIVSVALLNAAITLVGTTGKTGGMNYLVNLLGIGLASLMVMIKSGEWANDIVGA